MLAERFEGNPILIPNKEQSWEAGAVFNGCPIEKNGKIYLLYRALSLPHYHTGAGVKLTVSDVGIAESENGFDFKNRRRLIVPEHDWERFGCEDPRVTKLNGKYYIFYTALGGWPPRAEAIRVGVAVSEDLETIKEKHLVTPFNSKAMALFPERVDGKMGVFLTVNTDRPPANICFAAFEKEEEMWSDSYWREWYRDLKQHSLPLRRRPHDHVEVGAPPVKTEHGWLLLYSYIRDYYSHDRTFGVEAALLDLNDPLEILARTDFPVLFPEEYYERYGMVSNVVFPSGARAKEGRIDLYYGAADTTCCVASLELPSFMEQLRESQKRTVSVSRAAENPIIAPSKRPWENKAVFNPAALFLDGKVHLLYRAMSHENTSVMGYARSEDGISIDYRSAEPVYVPREEFEQKKQPGGNSGCEDPRLVKIGKRIYLFYTAFNGKDVPRVALSSIKEVDFLDQEWNWETPVLISPPGVDNKDAAMFPEKIDGYYVIIHRSGDDIDLSFNESLEFDGNWLEEYRWIRPRPGWWDSLKLGIASPPHKTEKGWLALYHGVSAEDGVYRVGAVLTELDDPTKIKGRTDYPIFEPEMRYERKGQVSNVVFPCGSVIIDGEIFIYYGGADRVVGVATVSLEALLDELTFG